MRVAHGYTAVFDDPNLVSCAGLAPVLELAERAGLQDLAADHLKRNGGSGLSGGGAAGVPGSRPCRRRLRYRGGTGCARSAAWAEPLRGWFRGSAMQFVGRRSYAIYLFHPLVCSAVALVVTQQNHAWPAVYLALTFAGSLCAADLLYRTVERPLIRLGHRMTRSDRLDRVAALPA